MLPCTVSNQQHGSNDNDDNVSAAVFDSFANVCNINDVRHWSSMTDDDDPSTLTIDSLKRSRELYIGSSEVSMAMADASSEMFATLACTSQVSISCSVFSAKAPSATTASTPAMTASTSAAPAGPAQMTMDLSQQDASASADPAPDTATTATAATAAE